MRFFILFTFISIALASCKRQANRDIPMKLTGQLYYVAPDIDPKDGHLSGACDCCSQNVAFLNDSEYVSVNYCEGDESYMKGKYKIKDKVVVFTTDGILVDREINWEKELDTLHRDLPDFHVSIGRVKSESYRWIQFERNGKLYFKTNEKEISYASVDPNLKLDRFVKGLKTDSLWYKLGME